MWCPMLCAGQETIHLAFPLSALLSAMQADRRAASQAQRGLQSVLAEPFSPAAMSTSFNSVYYSQFKNSIIIPFKIYMWCRVKVQKNRILFVVILVF